MAVDSSRAAVSLALFPFNASSSASQCLVMVGLRGMRGDGKEREGRGGEGERKRGRKVRWRGEERRREEITQIHLD